MKKETTDAPKTCFFIAPIGDEGSDERRRSDQVLNHIVALAAKECGYETIRADQISEAGIITSQVIQHVLDDPLVVADLTDRNPNVFYELAIRHAIRKPVVQIIHRSQPIPFDVAGNRTIQFDHHDLDSSAKARVDITGQIRAFEKNPKDVDTPITVALELQHLRQSDNPLEKSNAEIIVMLQEILELVRGQKRRVDQIEKSQTIEEMTRKVDREMVRRMLDPSAALKEGLATMNFDSVLSREVEKYLAKKKVGGALSSDFPLAEDHAEDEKNALARIMAEINKNKNLYANPTSATQP